MDLESGTPHTWSEDFTTVPQSRRGQDRSIALHEVSSSLLVYNAMNYFKGISPPVAENVCILLMNRWIDYGKYV